MPTLNLTTWIGNISNTGNRLKPTEGVVIRTKNHDNETHTSVDVTSTAHFYIKCILWGRPPRRVLTAEHNTSTAVDTQAREQSLNRCRGIGSTPQIPSVHDNDVVWKQAMGDSVRSGCRAFMGQMGWIFFLTMADLFCDSKRPVCPCHSFCHNPIWKPYHHVCTSMHRCCHRTLTSSNRPWACTISDVHSPSNANQRPSSNWRRQSNRSSLNLAREYLEVYEVDGVSHIKFTNHVFWSTCYTKVVL